MKFLRRLKVAWLVLFKRVQITSARERYLLGIIEDQKEHIQRLEEEIMTK